MTNTFVFNIDTFIEIFNKNHRYVLSFVESLIKIQNNLSLCSSELERKKSFYKLLILGKLLDLFF